MCFLCDGVFRRKSILCFKHRISFCNVCKHYYFSILQQLAKILWFKISNCPQMIYLLFSSSKKLMTSLCCTTGFAGSARYTALGFWLHTAKLIHKSHCKRVSTYIWPSFASNIVYFCNCLLLQWTDAQLPFLFHLIFNPKSNDWALFPWLLGRLS